MCPPPIGWSFIRGKSQIAMVDGRVCRVVLMRGRLYSEDSPSVKKRSYKSGGR